MIQVATLTTFAAIAVGSLATAGAFYALSLKFRKERNEYASELTKRNQQLIAARADHDLAIEQAEAARAQLNALRVDRQQNWVPKPKHGQGGKFVKADGAQDSVR